MRNLRALKSLKKKARRPEFELSRSKKTETNEEKWNEKDRPSVPRSAFKRGGTKRTVPLFRDGPNI